MLGIIATPYVGLPIIQLPSMMLSLPPAIKMPAPMAGYVMHRGPAVRADAMDEKRHTEGDQGHRTRQNGQRPDDESVTPLLLGGNNRHHEMQHNRQRLRGPASYSVYAIRRGGQQIQNECLVQRKALVGIL